MPSSSATSLARNRANGSAAAPLDDQLDDVARQHEHERDEHREVGGRERVEDELGQEVRRERGERLATRQNRDEHADEHGDAGENQPRVVAERTAAARRRAAAPERWTDVARLT